MPAKSTVKEGSLFWADQLADEVIKREDRLERGIKLFRTESGTGASGIPHIGSLGDVIRAYSVALAIEDKGRKAEFIPYSDNRDGLRKVPSGFSNELEKHLGVPVTDIPDTFKCHNSFGEHMMSLLQEAIDAVGVDAKLRSAAEDYKKGVYNEAIHSILLNADKVGKIIKEAVGQEKFLDVYPYLPVCVKCGNIYTTRTYKVLPKEHKVLYKCDQEFKGSNRNTGKDVFVRGCGHEGEASYFNGSGKVAWKAEFAVRWSSLKILFEPIGKDILDSIRVNDRICKEVLEFDPPVHARYEMFLEKGGKKISKSVGNVFTPQDWLRFGSPMSLRLLMLKRFTGTRELAPSDIPKYMDEVDHLERVYFGEEKVSNERELRHLKRLFEYTNFLQKPKEGLKIPYQALVNAVKVLPTGSKAEAIKTVLLQSKHLPAKLSKEQGRELKERIAYAANWAQAMQAEGIKEVKLGERERKALHELAGQLDSRPMKADEIQTLVFNTAKANKIEASKLFKALYQIILGTDRGPRAGNLIEIMGRKKAADLLKKA